MDGLSIRLETALIISNTIQASRPCGNHPATHCCTSNAAVVAIGLFVYLLSGFKASVLEEKGYKRFSAAPNCNSVMRFAIQSTTPICSV